MLGSPPEPLDDLLVSICVARKTLIDDFKQTVDFDSLEDKAVTVRDRDSPTQERVPIARLVEAVNSRLAW